MSELLGGVLVNQKGDTFSSHCIVCNYCSGLILKSSYSTNIDICYAQILDFVDGTIVNDINIGLNLFN